MDKMEAEGGRRNEERGKEREKKGTEKTVEESRYLSPAEPALQGRKEEKRREES